MNYTDLLLIEQRLVQLGIREHRQYTPNAWQEGQYVYAEWINRIEEELEYYNKKYDCNEITKTWYASIIKIYPTLKQEDVDRWYRILDKAEARQPRFVRIIPRAGERYTMSIYKY